MAVIAVASSYGGRGMAAMSTVGLPSSRPPCGAVPGAPSEAAASAFCLISCPSPNSARMLGSLMVTTHSTSWRISLTNSTYPANRSGASGRSEPPPAANHCG